MSDFDPLYNFYRYLDPKIDLETKGVQLSAYSAGTTKPITSEVDITKIVYKKYIAGSISGQLLTADATLKTNSKEGLFYNTAYQAATGKTTTYLASDYWAHVPHAAGSKNSGKKQGDPVVAPTNYYNEVCGVNDDPPTAFSINLLKSPLLTNARRNIDEIQTYLNYIPSIFASNMVPYFDVEFQLPQPEGNLDEQGVPRNLNRPSLLRFLLGSKNIEKEKDKLVLTDAEKSLIKVIDTPSKDPQGPQKSSFTGMEIFTTPQTLVNMDSLGLDGSRINPANPFLPPATLIGGSVQVQNAGAGMFTHKTANIDFVVHDKNRLVEFSGFMRGPAGYSDVTVWLTYGWLAPRSYGDEDIYAKFINYNMLVREAYMVKNTSFSFDTVGRVTVKVELVSKAIGPIETYSLDKVGGGAEDLTRQLKKLSETVSFIKDNASVFGEPPEGMKDMRFYQVLGAASEGNLNIDIPYEQVKALVKAAKANLNKTDAKGKPRLSQLEIFKATIVLDQVERLYHPTTLKAIKEASTQYIKTRLDTCFDSNSKDPFLPIADKDKYFANDLITECAKGIPYAAPVTGSKTDGSKLPLLPDADIQKSMPAVISLGKLFSVFCLPSILKCADEQGIDEVQVNFYQFNESCGPLSYANIAEFPIDLRYFYLQFQGFIEERGGEAMTLQDFLQFVITTQVMDNRALGYGMKDFYQPYTLDNLSEANQVKEFDSLMAAWIATYKSLKQPNIVIYTQTLQIQKEGDSQAKQVDLLQKISSTVGSYYNEPSFDGSGTQQKMLKIHIYDKSLEPYAPVAQTVFRGPNGFSVVPDKLLPDASREKAEFNKFLNARGKIILAEGDSKDPSKIVSRNVLSDYVGNTVPTITYGTNGTMIMNASLASNTNGLLGTINLLGGSQKASSKLSDNGLTQDANNIPMRIVPAQLTMTTKGCPLAEPYQSFFIDFGTGTTLDNLYTSTQVSHTFNPGKYETNWTFVYSDGYGKFFSATSPTEYLEKLAEEEREAAASLKAAEEEARRTKKPAPKPKGQPAAKPAAKK